MNQAHFGAPVHCGSGAKGLRVNEDQDLNLFSEDVRDGMERGGCTHACPRTMFHCKICAKQVY